MLFLRKGKRTWVWDSEWERGPEKESGKRRFRREGTGIKGKDYQKKKKRERGRGGKIRELKIT